LNRAQWKIFCDFRDDFKSQCKKWNAEFGEKLISLQREASKADTPAYPLETQVVYNTALDELTENSDIKLIVIGDNPGKDEQLAKNNRYLVGQAGKIAEGYFRRNPELGIDFRRNVIILNKTPVHSAKTAQLKTIAKQGGKKIADLIEESQIWMAKRTAQLHAELGTELWLVGYSELKEKGIFASYRDTLKASCTPKAWQKVFVFQHFSMNRFTIDLGDYINNKSKEAQKNATLESNIHELGVLHRNEIFKA
jgi:hypothetical protein